jgi:hypothetical protein
MVYGNSSSENIQYAPNLSKWSLLGLYTISILTHHIRGNSCSYINRYKHGDGVHFGLITGKLNVDSMCSHQHKWIIIVVTSVWEAMQHETGRHGLSSEILSFFVTINFKHQHLPLVCPINVWGQKKCVPISSRINFVRFHITHSTCSRYCSLTISQQSSPILQISARNKSNRNNETSKSHNNSHNSSLLETFGRVDW